MYRTTHSSTSLYDVLEVGDRYTLKEGKTGVVVEGPKFFYDDKCIFHEYIMALINPTNDEKHAGTLYAFVVMNACSYDAPSVTFISGNPFKYDLYGIPKRRDTYRVGYHSHHYDRDVDPYVNEGRSSRSDEVALEANDNQRSSSSDFLRTSTYGSIIEDFCGMDIDG